MFAEEVGGFGSFIPICLIQRGLAIQFFLIHLRSVGNKQFANLRSFFFIKLSCHYMKRRFPGFIFHIHIRTLRNKQFDQV